MLGLDTKEITYCRLGFNIRMKIIIMHLLSPNDRWHPCEHVLSLTYTVSSLLLTLWVLFNFPFNLTNDRKIRRQSQWLNVTTCTQWQDHLNWSWHKILIHYQNDLTSCLKTLVGGPTQFWICLPPLGCNIRESLKVTIRSMAVITMWLFFPQFIYGVACCLSLHVAVNYRKVHECFYINVY